MLGNETPLSVRIRRFLADEGGLTSHADMLAVIATEIRATLLRLNSEFAHYVPAGRQTPRVELRPVDDPEYFPAGVKHRYTRAGA